MRVSFKVKGLKISLAWYKNNRIRRKVSTTIRKQMCVCVWLGALLQLQSTPKAIGCEVMPITNMRYNGEPRTAYMNTHKKIHQWDAWGQSRPQEHVNWCSLRGRTRGVLKHKWLNWIVLVFSCTQYDLFTLDEKEKTSLHYRDIFDGSLLKSLWILDQCQA